MLTISKPTTRKFQLTDGIYWYTVLLTHEPKEGEAIEDVPMTCTCWEWHQRKENSWQCEHIKDAIKFSQGLTQKASEPERNESSFVRRNCGIQLDYSHLLWNKNEKKENFPMTLTDVHPQLIYPFAPKEIELKAGKFTSNGTQAYALAYVDARAYQERLDQVVGPENWSVEYRLLSDRAVICRLTILGHIREEVGEYTPRNGQTLNNPWTSAVAQAFKRACSAFGIGRYLYKMPKIWGEYLPERDCFANPQELVSQMYQESELICEEDQIDQDKEI